MINGFREEPTMSRKDYRDFDVVGGNYVTEKDLDVGDFFMEDTYPEVYQVTSRIPDPLGDMVNIVFAKCITTGEVDVVLFNCDSLVLLKPKE
jgi:hypothetical protein